MRATQRDKFGMRSENMCPKAHVCLLLYLLLLEYQEINPRRLQAQC